LSVFVGRTKTEIATVRAIHNSAPRDVVVVMIKPASGINRGPETIVATIHAELVRDSREPGVISIRRVEIAVFTIDEANRMPENAKMAPPSPGSPAGKTGYTK